MDKLEPIAPCKRRELLYLTIKKNKNASDYSNFDEKIVTGSKAFWKTVKPFLSDKIMFKEK